MGWAWYVAHMGARKGGGGCAQDCSGETWELPIGRSRRRWECNIIGEACAAYNVILRRDRVVIVGAEKQ